LKDEDVRDGCSRKKELSSLLTSCSFTITIMMKINRRISLMFSAFKQLLPALLNQAEEGKEKLRTWTASRKIAAELSHQKKETKNRQWTQTKDSRQRTTKTNQSKDEGNEGERIRTRNSFCH